MGYKNAEGYSDTTAGQALSNIAREQRKMDKMKFYEQFNTYEELREYTMKQKPELKTKAQADKFIREKMPHESYFQKKIKEYIQKTFPDAFIWKAAAGAYSQSGIPDLCCIIHGRYYGFEIKRPFIGEPSDTQRKAIKDIRSAGGTAAVVATIKQVKKILLPEMRKPLSISELKEMAGQPVWCSDTESYGIVKCDKIGSWAGIPFLHGSWYNEENGISSDFEYDIQRRELKCYRVDGGRNERR